MARVAYILLCHKDPEAIISQAKRLTKAGDYISIHFDKRAGREAFKTLKAGLKDNPNVVFAAKRIKCGWGEWSLVEATIHAVKAAEAAFPRATHFYMLSGDCMAIKPAKYIHQFLDSNDFDYIESFDFFESNWIKTGIKEERLIYRHYFNERENKWLFYQSFWLQRHLGWKREIPADLKIMIGSQWWCLRRDTIEKILQFIRTRKDAIKFFSTTWIPDETFFQTVVRHLISRDEIKSRTLTFLMFTDYGMPQVFYNDHYDLLRSQDYLFARKISPEAKELKQKLGVLFASDDEIDISNEGRTLFSFLTSRGRVGKRFAQRFWESESSLGRNRELYIVTCKKWHVAKRLISQIRDKTDLICLDYLFNEKACPLPDLGGIEKSLTKRTRHRRAWMRMLFDYFNTNKIIICVDPANIDFIHDFYADRARTRLLEIECNFSRDYLVGHTMRTGLTGEQTPQSAIDLLIPTVHADINEEMDEIRDANFTRYSRISENKSIKENAQPLAEFLDIDLETADDILSIHYLYSD